MRVTRLIVYEGDPEWVVKTLSNSMPDGTTRPGPANNTLTIITLQNNQHETDLINELTEVMGVHPHGLHHEPFVTIDNNV